ncbi:hypothetical protein AMJ86_08720 [bacterium SM23_57]|jgi:hypothetical protein|nr:MAG: hypothetical protein AMJ86_08720 [bacterium SM23_57]
MGVAEVTTGAFLRCYHNGNIFLVIKSQYFGGAELNTDMTSLAPLSIDKNLPAWFLGIPSSRGFECIQLGLSNHVHLYFAMNITCIEYGRSAMDFEPATLAINNFSFFLIYCDKQEQVRFAINSPDLNYPV